MRKLWKNRCWYFLEYIRWLGHIETRIWEQLEAWHENWGRAQILRNPELSSRWDSCTQTLVVYLAWNCVTYLKCVFLKNICCWLPNYCIHKVCVAILLYLSIVVRRQKSRYPLRGVMHAPWENSREGDRVSLRDNECGDCMSVLWGWVDVTWSGMSRDVLECVIEKALVGGGWHVYEVLRNSSRCFLIHFISIHAYI